MTPEVIQTQEKPGLSEISSTIRRFLKSQFFGNLAENSQLAYRSDLAKLDSFCQSEHILSFSQLPQMYDTFISELRSRHQDSTVRRTLSATRMFLGWTVTEKITSPGLKEHFPQVRFIKKSSEVIQKDKTRELVLRARRVSLRDTTLILLLLKTGAKLKEILDLKFSDVLTRNNQVRVWFGRKDKSRVITLDRQSQRTLLEYLAEPRNHHQEKIFAARTSTKSGVLTRQDLWLRVKKYGRDIGLPSLGPQILRNTWRARYKRRTDMIYCQRLPES